VNRGDLSPAACPKTFSVVLDIRLVLRTLWQCETAKPLSHMALPNAKPFSGWWLGLLFPIYGKIKFMFQTTNQILGKITRKKHVDPGLF